jgi:hypothetical protein
VTENPEHDIDFYKMTVDDIARTKNRQFQITYYSAVVTGSVIVAVRLTSELPEGSPLVAGLLIAAIAANAVATTVFQFGLDASLQKFRTRLRDLGQKLGRANLSPAIKRSRDLPLTFYFVGFPWAIGIFATWFTWAVLMN